MVRLLETLLRQSVFLTAAGDSKPYWQPSADIYQTADGWLVKFDLAGVRPDEIELNVSDRRLHIRGVRRDWTIGECQHSYSMEISYNRFERTLEFPCNIQHAETRTEYRDGMLLVRLVCEGA